MIVKVKVKSNKGFTLAEVLVTLAIIGVVAALTIPTLIQSSANGKIVAGVRKAQSVLNGALLRYAVDNGCEGDFRTCGVFDTSSLGAWNALRPYFAVAKDCGLATGQGCWAKGVAYKFVDGTNTSVYDDWGIAKSVLVDGFSLALFDYGGNCTVDASRSDTGSLLYVCGFFYVDINGHKGPNQFGRDAFIFYITKQGVYPAGHYDDANYSSVAGEPACDPAAALPSGGYGYGCTAKILMEGTVNY